MNQALTRAILAATTLALTVPACGGSAFAAYATPDEIQSALTTYVARTPGVVVIAGVMDHGNTHVYMAGTPPTGAPALNENSIFQIGSLSKTFTATLLADLVHRGRVHLDDTVATCLPSVHMPSYQGKQITFLSLAEQNSGLPRLPSNLNVTNEDDPYATYTDQDLDRFLAGYKMTRQPGAQYEYSNLGVGLLGAALANCMHTSYPALLKSNVLAPLGMNDTGINFASSSHLMPGFSDRLKPAPPWTGAFLAPFGGLYSTMHDMLRFLKANIEAPSGALGYALATTQEPRASMDGPPYAKIGLIWQVNTVNGNVWHNGQVGGYHALMLFNRADASGVVLLTNVADMNADNLAYHIIAPKLVPAPTSVLALNSQPSPTGTSIYAGIYRFSPTFAITISGDDRALQAQATGQQPLALTHVSETTYAVAGVDAQITFVRDRTGKITALVLHQNSMAQTGQRQP